jgi:hypothetical protein
MAFIWGLIACGGAVSTASAQGQASPKPAPEPSVMQWKEALQDRIHVNATRSTAPWIPQRFQPVQQDKPLQNEFKLSDQHTIVVSTLVLVLAGVIVLLLIL